MTDSEWMGNRELQDDVANRRYRARGTQPADEMQSVAGQGSQQKYRRTVVAVRWHRTTEKTARQAVLI
jgi:hypothetical protein